jgi:hypothetical protein
LELFNNVIVGNGAAADCDDLPANGTYVIDAPNNVFGSSGDARGCTGYDTEIGNVVPSGTAGTMVQMAGGVPVVTAHGGPTSTVALAAGSPAIDAGDQTLLPGESDLGYDLDGTDDPIDVDQRGAPRVVDVEVDAGAVENVIAAPRRCPPSYSWAGGT